MTPLQTRKGPKLDLFGMREASIRGSAAPYNFEARCRVKELPLDLVLAQPQRKHA